MATIVDAANCSVSPGTDGAWLVTKTGGSEGVGDAGAVSAAAIAGDFILRVRPLGAGTGYFGVSANPFAGIAPASIDRALWVSGTNCRAYDSGVARPGLFPSDTFLWMRRDSGVLTYLTGPDLGSAIIKRTVEGMEGPLSFDSSLLTLGLTIEVKFDPPAGFLGRPKARPPAALAFTF